MEIHPSTQYDGKNDFNLRVPKEEDKSQQNTVKHPVHLRVKPILNGEFCKVDFPILEVINTENNSIRILNTQHKHSENKNEREFINRAGLNNESDLPQVFNVKINGNLFSSRDENTRIYEKCLKNCVYDLMKGISCTLVLVGEQESGKSHTILGDRNSPGLLPQAVYDILSLVKSSSNDTSSIDYGYSRPKFWANQREPNAQEIDLFNVRCSCLEVVNEKVIDLLRASSNCLWKDELPELKVSDSGNHKCEIEGLKEVSISNQKEFMRMLVKLMEFKKRRDCFRPKVANMVFITKLERISRGNFHNGIELHTTGTFNVVELGDCRYLSAGTPEEVQANNRSLFNFCNILLDRNENYEKQSVLEQAKSSILTKLISDTLIGDSIGIVIGCIDPKRKEIEVSWDIIKFLEQISGFKSKLKTNSFNYFNSWFFKWKKSLDCLMMEYMMLHNVSVPFSSCYSSLNREQKSHYNEKIKKEIANLNKMIVDGANQDFRLLETSRLSVIAKIFNEIEHREENINEQIKLRLSKSLFKNLEGDALDKKDPEESSPELELTIRMTFLEIKSSGEMCEESRRPESKSFIDDNSRSRGFNKYDLEREDNSSYNNFHKGSSNEVTSRSKYKNKKKHLTAEISLHIQKVNDLSKIGENVSEGRFWSNSKVSSNSWDNTKCLSSHNTQIDPEQLAWKKMNKHQMYYMNTLRDNQNLGSDKQSNSRASKASSKELKDMKKLNSEITTSNPDSFINGTNNSKQLPIELERKLLRPECEKNSTNDDSLSAKKQLHNSLPTGQLATSQLVTNPKEMNNQGSNNSQASDLIEPKLHKSHESKSETYSSKSSNSPTVPAHTNENKTSAANSNDREQVLLNTNSVSSQSNMKFTRQIKTDKGNVRPKVSDGTKALPDYTPSNVNIKERSSTIEPCAKEINLTRLLSNQISPKFRRNIPNSSIVISEIKLFLKKDNLNCCDSTSKRVNYDFQYKEQHIKQVVATNEDRSRYTGPYITNKEGSQTLLDGTHKRKVDSLISLEPQNRINEEKYYYKNVVSNPVLPKVPTPEIKVLKEEPISYGSNNELKNDLINMTSKKREPKKVSKHTGCIKLEGTIDFIPK